MTSWASRAAVGLAGIMFTTSGFTALVYQSVLNKYFSFIFGVSGYATAIVLATFMAGLAIGSWGAGKRCASIRHPIAAYGACEMLIGFWGLVIMPLGSSLEHALLTLSPNAALVFAFRAVLALVLVAPPTLLMGA